MAAEWECISYRQLGGTVVFVGIRHAVAFLLKKFKLELGRVGGKKTQAPKKT